MRQVHVESGAVEASTALEQQWFGEGLARLGTKLYQLTWQTPTGFVYDAAGNLTQSPAASGTDVFAYDSENRLSVANYAGENAINYLYGVSGERLFDGSYWRFYGPDGTRLGAYFFYNGTVAHFADELHFAGRLVWQDNYPVVTDRLGSVVQNSALTSVSTRGYYPYGVKSSQGSGSWEPTPPCWPYCLSPSWYAGQTVGFGSYQQHTAPNSSTPVGLDYAMNRYYDPARGRFTTPDPSESGSIGTPLSWNRYAYVGGDPVNQSDPSGLCSVIVGGLTQTPYTDKTSAQQEFANEVGAISAFPYAGGSQAGGVANIMKQGLGMPTGATLTALQAIAMAAQNSGPISIYAFSGGAQAFSTAWNYLTSDVQNRIKNITYIAPAAASDLQGGNGANVRVYGDQADSVNLALRLVNGAEPSNTQFFDTGSCGHNANCIFAKYAASLEDNATSCPVGGGSVFGAPSHPRWQLGPGQGFIDPWTPVTVYYWDAPPVPWVTSRFLP